jgi:hypothetical protein
MKLDYSLVNAFFGDLFFICIRGKDLKKEEENNFSVIPKELNIYVDIVL